MIQRRNQVSQIKDKLERWAVHKQKTMPLTEAYEAVNPDKADRIRNCCQIVAKETMQDDSVRYIAKHCHIRLCPICAWRRSDKTFSQLMKVGGEIRKDYSHYHFLFLTLTQENCLPENLSDELTHVLGAFNKMTRTKLFKAAIKGYCRSMEVTHNITKDTYHPHIHVILVVDHRYFTGPAYIDHSQWISMWQKALGVSYPPNVDVRRIKGRLDKAIAETAKYSVKSADYIMPENWEFTVRTVRLLDSALHNRRFVSFGGIFKEYHKKLNLSNPDQDPNEDVTPGIQPVHTQLFAWCSTYQQYREVSC